MHLLSLVITYYPSYVQGLVWTPCLMHRCVYFTVHIQNYNYKLHFQNLSIYHISHVSIWTLAAENLDVCTACDPWLMSEIATYSWPWEKTRDSKYMFGLLLIYWYQNLEGAPPGPGHAFPWQRHMCRGRGGLFISVRLFFPVWCHPRMDDGMDGWKPSRKTTTTSFTICNYTPQDWLPRWNPTSSQLLVPIHNWEPWEASIEWCTGHSWLILAGCFLESMILLLT
jgi:hypothetical protein